ncbi:MAG: NfeD family protein [Lachnospiraceae bacterium]|nr:NfeD family protein [Lachnospiraceae bacterium]
MTTLNLTIMWLVLLVVLVIIELATMGLTTIWFAGGALVAALVSIPGTPIWLQIIVFLVVSALLLYFTRPIAVKYFNRDRIRTNTESLIGRQAIVISEINNIEGTGQVNAGGMEWTARSSYNNVVLPVGAVVTILGIDGVKLIVEERKEG